MIHLHGSTLALLCLCFMGPAVAGWPTVALPEGSQGETVSEHMNYNGLKMRASHFQTSQQPVEVIAFYAKEWKGKYVVDKLGSKTIVGHAEGNHYITVELEGVGGGTKATLGIVELPKDRTKPNLGEGFYRPAGTTVVSDIRYLDTPEQARTLVLENELSPYVNQQHYFQRLRTQGWRSVSNGNCKPSSTECVARFEKAGGGKMVMTMTRESGMTTATVVNIE